MKEKEPDSVIKFLKEIESNPSTGHILTLISGNHRFEDYKAYRNFNIGDRVKVFFKDEWHLGTIVDKYFKKTPSSHFSYRNHRENFRLN